MFTPRTLLAKLVAALIVALAVALPVFAANPADNGNNSPSLTIDKPASVQEGHFMLAQIAFRGAETLQVNAPDGWVLIAKRTNTENVTAGERITQAVYRKTAGPSEPASYQWTFGASGTTNTPALGGINSYEDIDTATPIDASATNPVSDSALATSTTPTAPEVTTTQAHARVVSFWAYESDATFTKPGSMNLLYSHGRESGNAGTRARIGAADVIQTTPGLSGTKQATASPTTRYVAQTIALRRKATKLAFTTAPNSGLKNTCMGPITVQSQGEDDPVNVTADTVVDLTTDGTGSFFSDGGCATALTEANRTIPNGSNSFSFFYKPTVTGDGTHLLTASTTGLTSGTQTQTVTKLNQTITFNDAPASATFGTTFNVNPSASPSGLPVALATSGGCTAVPDASPPGFDVTMTSGTTTCQLTASQAGDDDYNAASNEVRNVTAVKAAQTITFDDAPSTAQTFGTTFHVNPTSDSGLTVTVADGGSPEGCDATLNAPGYDVEVTRGNQPCNLTATQTGNANYAAATPVLRTVQTQKANQTITFAQPPSPQTYGTTFGIGSATSDSGLAVTVTPTGGCSLAGSDATMTSGVTDCVLTASQAGNGNYNAATNVARTVVAAKKGLTVTGAAAQGKTYDGTAAATADFGAATLDGIINADDVTLDSSGYSAAFDNKNVGTAKPVSVSGLALSGTSAPNYSVASPTGLTADVTKKDTTGSFTAADKVYDGTTAANISGQSLAGEVSGDDVDLTGTAAFASKTVGDDKPVSLSGAALTGADKDNYSLVGSVPDAAADITRKSVTGDFTAADKDFDGTTAATITGRSLTGAIAGDAVALTGGTATFSDANPGVDKTVTGTGFALGGADAGNYALGSVGTTTATIRQRDPGEAPPGEKSLSEKAADLLGGPVKLLDLDLGNLGFAFARKSQGKAIKPINQKLFAIGGCTVPCTIAAAKTIVLTTGAGASAAATRKIKLKTQKLSLAANQLGVVKLKLTRKQKKAIKKANKAKLVVKVTLKAGAQKVTGKKTYRFKKP